MTTKSRRMRRWMVWAATGFLAAGGLTGACGGKTTGTPVVGSESHFLMRCSDCCEGDLACIGGICTRSCITGEPSCGALSPSATCTNRSVEPGDVAVCDVSCTDRADCAELGDGHLCDGGFCRLAAAGAARLDAALCTDFEDQPPPPTEYGITIVNTGRDTLYVLPHLPPCSERSTLLRAFRVGAGGAPISELDLQGPGCAPRCSDVMANGWRLPDEGSLSHDCVGVACAAPSGGLAIEPGGTLFQGMGTEYVPARLPRGCASGIMTDAVNCYQRVAPQPLEPGSGVYRFVLRASATPECGSDCEPLAFSLESSSFFTDQVLEIASAPAAP